MCAHLGAPNADSLPGTHLRNHSVILGQQERPPSATEALAETLRAWGPPRARLPRFEVRFLSGEVINMRQYSTRIYQNTDVSWVIQAVANVLAWPPEYLIIYIGRRQFQYAHRLAQRDRTTLLQLILELWGDIAVGHSQERLIIHVERKRPPDTFENSGGASHPVYCICDFPGHGCCRKGREDHLARECDRTQRAGQGSHWGCQWCGNNATCRNRSCDHTCCGNSD